MSVRTKPSFVYVIWRADGAHKIGVSWYPEDRMCDIRRGTPGFPEMRLVGTWDRRERGDASKVESKAHVLLKEQALGSEWFRVSETEARDEVHFAIGYVENPTPRSFGPHERPVGWKRPPLTVQPAQHDFYAEACMKFGKKKVDEEIALMHKGIELAKEAAATGRIYVVGRSLEDMPMIGADRLPPISRHGAEA